MSNFFKSSPTVVALLRRDVPRPATLPEERLGGARWCVPWGVGGTKQWTCPMGLHTSAPAPCPLGEMFPASAIEVRRFAESWDNLKPDQYQAAMDEIWPQEEHND
jgi:hypothetical protein